VSLHGACRRPGVRVVCFHGLRHAFGTRVAASGEVSLRTLQERMGHSDVKTMLIYADYQPSEHEAKIVSRAFGVDDR
jgi:integrase